MEILLRIFAALQQLLCFLLEPLYWLQTKTKTTVPLQTIRNPILTLSATQLAEKIRTGELTSEEVVEIYSFRNRRVNIKLNAVVDERYDEALREAEKVDEMIASGIKSVKQLEEETPLLGVPVSISDCFKVKGLRHRVGCMGRDEERAEYDGEAVVELRKAGAIPLVTTNTSELCFPTETNNPVTGLTKNPYNYHHTVGSAAGGEASLIGGAGSVVGIGSEWLGSIRGPAMYAGIFAHRPTQGVCPVSCHPPEAGQNVVVGPLARYAEDLSLMLKVLVGNNATQLRLDEPVSPSEIEVFYLTDSGYSLGIPTVDWEIKQAVVKAVDHLKTDCKCNVQEVYYEEMASSLEICRTVLYNERHLPAIFEGGEAISHKGRPNLLQEITKVFAMLTTYSLHALFFNIMKNTGGFLSGKRITQYMIEKEVLKKNLIARLGKNGVLIMPTQPTAAHYHHQWLLRPAQGVYSDLINALGLPATNVPMGLNYKGLPIGVQVVGAPYQDRLCLAVAQQLENAFGGWVQPPCLKPPSET